MIPTPLDFPTGIALLGSATTDSTPQAIQILWGAILFLAGFILAVLTSALWRKNREHQRPLESSKSLPQSLLNNSSKLFFARYESGDNLVFISPGVETITGIRPEELISGTISLHSAIHELDRHLPEQAATSRARLDPESIQYQCRIRTPDGSWRWMHVEQIAILDSRGRAHAHETISQDITDQYRLQEKTLEQLKLQQLRSSALEHIVSAEDLPAGFEPTLELIKNYFPLDHASILEMDFHSHTASEISTNPSGSGIDSPAKLPLEGKVAENWMRRIQGGEPMVISPSTIKSEASIIRNAFEGDMACSILIVPLMVNGKVEHAIFLQQSRRAPKRKTLGSPSVTAQSLYCRRKISLI